MNRRRFPINSVHLGNGITIFRKGSEEIIAHIDKNRNVQWYIDEYTLSSATKNEILAIASYDDREISATQSEKVFKVRPRNYYILVLSTMNSKQSTTIYVGNIDIDKLDVVGKFIKVNAYLLQPDGSRKFIKRL